MHSFLELSLQTFEFLAGNGFKPTGWMATQEYSENICREPVGNVKMDRSANKYASEVRKLRKKVRTGKKKSW